MHEVGILNILTGLQTTTIHICIVTNMLQLLLFAIKTHTSTCLQQMLCKIISQKHNSGLGRLVSIKMQIKVHDGEQYYLGNINLILCSIDFNFINQYRWTAL